MFAAKLKAAAVHLSISIAIGLLVLVLVFYGWYRDQLAAVEGVGSILFIMLGIDIVLGPLMTLLVYAPQKKNLKLDLGLIGLVQLCFLVFGLYTVELGRPAFVVFDQNRFETVAYADLSETARQQLKDNTDPLAARSWFGPVWIATVLPDDPALRDKLISEAFQGGAELSLQPKYYRALSSVVPALLAEAKPLAHLKTIKGNDSALIDKSLAALKRSDSTTVKFLPLKGKKLDGVVLIDAKSAERLALELLKPWP
jgi:hypothetical protein